MIKQYLYKKGAALGIPISGVFELTPRCNLNCKMCYIHMTPEEQRGTGRELSTDEWLELGREAIEHGMIYLLITGGEPFLRPDFCRIYESLFNMGLLISINTNAVLLTDEILTCLVDHKPERINVSLYGANADTYERLCGCGTAYEQAVSHILQMRDAGLRVSINTTHTRYNASDMDALTAFAKQQGLPIRMAGMIFPPVRNTHEAAQQLLSPEEFGQLRCRFEKRIAPEEVFRKRSDWISGLGMELPSDDLISDECQPSSCMAGRASFWISWDGKMYPCGMLPNLAADLRNTSFLFAWKQIRDMVDNLRLPSECTLCRLRPLCSICAAINSAVNGDSAKVVKSLCAQTKAYAEAYRRFEK